MGRTTGRMDSAEQPNAPNKDREAEGPRGLEIRMARTGSTETSAKSTGAQDYRDQIKRPPDPTILQLHKHLHKAESTMLVQLRTGRAGFGIS
jgi:hypothetical protein